MIRRRMPRSSLDGYAFIQTHPRESAEEFEATKGGATYMHEGESHTLIFDGKTDQLIMDHLPGSSDQYVTDLNQLNGKYEDISAACEACDDIFNSQPEDLQVDLGTESKWFATPNFGAKQEIVGHTLYRVGGGKEHSISVSEQGDGLFFSVSTKLPEQKLGHYMSGQYLADGSLSTRKEVMTWR